MLLIGKKEYIEYWNKEAWVQITNDQGDLNFVPLVPLVDPDLTVYDDVSQILLENYDVGSQSARKKLVMAEKVVPTSQGPIAETYDEGENDVVPGDENECPELDPNDVSRCLNELPTANADRANQSNCSSTSANQVQGTTFIECFSCCNKAFNSKQFVSVFFFIFRSSFPEGCSDMSFILGRGEHSKND